MKKMSNCDQKKYIQEWKKNHKRAFKVDLNSEEYNELKELLKQNNWTCVQFVKNAIVALKENLNEENKK